MNSSKNMAAGGNKAIISQKCLQIATSLQFPARRLEVCEAGIVTWIITWQNIKKIKNDN